MKPKRASRLVAGLTGLAALVMGGCDHGKSCNWPPSPSWSGSWTTVDTPDKVVYRYSCGKFTSNSYRSEVFTRDNCGHLVLNSICFLKPNDAKDKDGHYWTDHSDEGSDGNGLLDQEEQNYNPLCPEFDEPPVVEEIIKPAIEPSSEDIF